MVISQLAKLKIIFASLTKKIKKPDFNLDFLICRADITNFELYLDFIKSQQKFQEMEQQIQEYAILTQGTYGSKFDFVI